MNKCFCDKCKGEITYDNFVKVEFRENNVYKFRDYHIDCFNYEFSCDIRKIKET